jgi:hypothetical protein
MAAEMSWFVDIEATPQNGVAVVVDDRNVSEVDPTAHGRQNR